MKIIIVKCLKDNYSYIIYNEQTLVSAVIDPSEADPIINEIEKNNLEEKYSSLSQELDTARKKIQELEVNLKKDRQKRNEFNQKIDELNQETEYLIEEIDKWQM